MTTLLDQAGVGTWNGGTSFDETTYYELGPKDALADLLMLEAARMVDPLANVGDEVFAVEREVVRNELRESNEMNFVGRPSRCSSALSSLLGTHTPARSSGRTRASTG